MKTSHLAIASVLAALGALSTNASAIPDIQNADPLPAPYWQNPVGGWCERNSGPANGYACKVVISSHTCARRYEWQSTPAPGAYHAVGCADSLGRTFGTVTDNPFDDDDDSDG